MGLRLALAGGHSFPPSSASGLATLAGGLLAVTRFPVNRPQVRIGVIIPSDDMVYLIGAWTVADVTDAPVITKDALALRMPFLGQAHTTGTALPLPGSHARILSRDLH